MVRVKLTTVRLGQTKRVYAWGRVGSVDLDLSNASHKSLQDSMVKIRLMHKFCTQRKLSLTWDRVARDNILEIFHKDDRESATIKGRENEYLD